MKVKLLVGLFATLCAVPANACYNGPTPVQFAGNSAKLTREDRSSLQWQISGLRDDFPRSTLLVIFYETSPKRLFDQRRKAVRNYLLANGVKPAAISIQIATKKPPTEFLADWTRGKVPTASVELSFGHCH